MALGLLSSRRRHAVVTLGMIVFSLLGCGGDNGNGPSALAPGSGPSAAPAPPVNVPPSSRFPPVIAGTPRIPAAQNTPVLVRALEETAPAAEDRPVLDQEQVLIEGPITALDAGAGWLAVMNSVLQTHPDTAIVIAPMHDTAVTLADLRSGDWVKVVARREPHGVSVTSLTAIPTPLGTEPASIRAHMTGISPGQHDTVTLWGTVIVLEPGTVFRLGHRIVNGDTFFSTADYKDAFTAEGTFTGTTLLAQSLTAQPRPAP